MRFSSLAAMILVLSFPSAARAQDVATLQHRIDQLESELKTLRERVDTLGSASRSRQVVLTVDPVFMGTGARPSPAPWPWRILASIARRVLSSLEFRY